MNKQYLLPLLILISQLALSGQNTAKLYIELRPADAQVRINGQDYNGEARNNSQFFDLELAPGNYLLEFWHPHLEMEIQELVLAAEEVKRLAVGMRNVNEAYQNYQEDRRSYSRDKTIRISAPILLGSMNAIGWYLVLKKPNSTDSDIVLSNINIVRQNYADAVGAEELALYENRYNELVAEYEDLTSNRNTRRTIGIAAMAGFSYLSFKLLQGLRRREHRPLPIFDPGAPFSLDYSPGPDGHQSFTARFTF